MLVRGVVDWQRAAWSINQPASFRGDCDCPVEFYIVFKMTIVLRI